MRNIAIIIRVERRRAISAPATAPVALPMAIGQARPRLRLPSEAYAAEPTKEISMTVASVVPETWAGLRVPVSRRRGAMADPPPIPSNPPSAPPASPINQKIAKLGDLEEGKRRVDGELRGRDQAELSERSRGAVCFTAIVLTFGSG